jgi:hypothetical protein
LTDEYEDLFPEDEEDESPEPSEDEQPIPAGDPQALARQLKNRDAIIQRLKSRQGKKIEAAAQQAAEEAVEIYKQEQARLGKTTRLFEKAGYPGLAHDFLALNEGEPTSEAVESFLAERRLQPASEPAPAFTGPPAAASFHAGGGGGTSSGAGPMTWAEYQEKARSDPAAAADEARRRGLEQLSGIGEL